MPVYAAFENGVAVKKSTEGRLDVADRPVQPEPIVFRALLAAWAEKNLTS